MTSVSQSSEYRLAVAQFARHDVRGALRQIDTLLKKPDITTEDRAFLFKQESICNKAFSGRTIASTAVALVPRRQSALTATQADCGPRALLIACEQMHVSAGLDALRKAAGTTGDGTNLAGLIYAAQTVGVKAEGVQMDGPALANLNTDKDPALAWVDGNHYIAVLSIHGDSATIHDPNKNRDEEITLNSGPAGLLARSGGILLLLSRGTETRAANKAAGT